MYPPDQVPPGVFPSGDHAEVATPISVSEWMLHYHAQHRALLDEHEERKAYEARRHAGVEKARATAAVAVQAAAHASKRQKTGAHSSVAVADDTHSDPPAAAPGPTPPAAPYLPPAGPVEAICEP